MVVVVEVEGFWIVVFGVVRLLLKLSVAAEGFGDPEGWISFRYSGLILSNIIFAMLQVIEM